jgi:hypothetical protein
MSIKQLFSASAVDYLLPSSAGVSAGESLVLAAPGSLVFSGSAPPPPSSSLTVPYVLSVAEGADSGVFSITFFMNDGVVQAYCNMGGLTVATAGAGEANLAAFIVSGTPPANLSDFLPQAGAISRAGSLLFEDFAGTTTFYGDSIIDSAGTFTFSGETGTTFVTGTVYQLGLGIVENASQYYMGQWLAAQ